MKETASDQGRTESSEHVIDKIQMDYCKATHTFAANLWEYHVVTSTYKSLTIYAYILSINIEAI